ncbi:MAG: T9SS type A sorting domain-containing protein, partial [Chitinophagales bacterium]
YYADTDNDGYGDPLISVVACVAPAGYVSNNTDCDIISEYINPGAAESCDGVDNNCNGSIDEGLVGCSIGPAIEWQNTLGGIYDDFLFDVAITSDGGFILGGYSASDVSPDKSENNINSTYDYWVVKLNNSGAIEWENTIGGIYNDMLYSIEQTADGGYILGGASASDISFDKTENNIGTVTTSTDYWVVKLNSTGSIEWQNTIGGTGNDNLYDIQQTVDGGYILGGTSYSNGNGDKTEDRYGQNDFWIVKLNATGNIVWQNTIGGSKIDYFKSLDQTADGGYIIGGDSESDISIDKTENSGDWDYWIVKLDVNGIIEWDNTICTNAEIDNLTTVEQTSDEGYFLSGYSRAGINCDKTEGSNDTETNYWVIKLDNGGNIVWQNSIEGEKYDYLNYAEQTADGGYILGGNSQSIIGYDKTEASFGNTQDFWIIKLDALGNIIWQNTIGGYGAEELKAIKQSPDGGYIIAGWSNSNISGDKTENCLGNMDYWVMKLGPEICAVPSGIYTNNITPTKATLHWDLVPGAASYQIYYRAVGAGTWIKKTSTTNFKTIKSLSPATNYQYKVRTKCSDASFGEFSALQNFTTLPLREGEIDNEIEINIYPNPADNFITISLGSSLTTYHPALTITNVMGETVFETKVDSPITEVNISHLPKGIYFLILNNGESNTSIKFIHQ